MKEDVPTNGTLCVPQCGIQNNSEPMRRNEPMLSPQPLRSPNDPLNWPLTRKLWHTFLLCFVTSLASASTNSVGIAQQGMLEEFGIALGVMDSGAGILFLGLGFGTFLISPAAWLYGRRLPYLICITLNILGMTWISNGRTKQDSIWAQLLVGAFGAIAEANIQLSLSEIWFEHQRGSVIGIYVLISSLGTFLAPLIGGFIIERMGWRWLPRLLIIISVITLVFFYFGLEETLFDPRSYGNSSIYQNFTDSCHTEQSKTYPRIVHAESPKTYWQRIQFVTLAPNLNGSGFTQYIIRLKHTLHIFAFPAVFYSGIQWGAQDAWLTFYLNLQEEKWSKPPHNYNESKIALMNIPTIIGASIGCFWGGYLSDRSLFYIAKRSDNIRQAEDRLLMMLPCIVLSPLGLIIFGIGTVDAWSWGWPYMGLGMIGFGWGCAGDLSMAYLIDAYPDAILEGMVGVSLVNNTFGCVFSLLAGPWFKYSGVRNCMIGVGCLSFIIFSLTIPMIIWGRKLRQRTDCRYRNFLETRDAI